MGAPKVVNDPSVLRHNAAHEWQLEDLQAWFDGVSIEPMHRGNDER
jgi:hypothetical protein